MGKQYKYFLAAVTIDNRYVTVKEIDEVEIKGQKTIDKFTSNYTKEELLRIIEREVSEELENLKLEYIQDEKNTYYYGIITNNKEFANCLSKMDKKKCDRIPMSERIFNREFDELLELIELYLPELKAIFGESSEIYSKAVNYKKEDKNKREAKEVLKEEFSKYINFRKWLAREEDPSHIIKKEEKKEKGEFKQMNIAEYLDILNRLPNLKEQKEEKKEEPTILDELKDVKRMLNEYNAKNDESLELGDFENPQDDVKVEGWEPKERTRKYEKE